MNRKLNIFVLKEDSFSLAIVSVQKQKKNVFGTPWSKLSLEIMMELSCELVLSVSEPPKKYEALCMPSDK